MYLLDMAYTSIDVRITAVQRQAAADASESRQGREAQLKKTLLQLRRAVPAEAYGKTTKP